MMQGGIEKRSRLRDIALVIHNLFKCFEIVSIRE